MLQSYVPIFPTLVLGPPNDSHLYTFGKIAFSPVELQGASSLASSQCF